MVFYTCNGCGESLKKNKVEKHVTVCRSCQYMTCMDCSKDFWGDEYKAHTSCISEEEKYGAAGLKVKPNKGDVKQKDWLKKVEEATSQCQGASSEAKDLLISLQEYGNIPRKKGKFLNFLKNSLNMRNEKLAEEVWEIFSKAKQAGDSGSNPASDNKQSNNGGKIGAPDAQCSATVDEKRQAADVALSEQTRKKVKKTKKNAASAKGSSPGDGVSSGGSGENGREVRSQDADDVTNSAGEAAAASSKQKKKKKRKMKNDANSSEESKACEQTNGSVEESAKKENVKKRNGVESDSAAGKANGDQSVDKSKRKKNRKRKIEKNPSSPEVSLARSESEINGKSERASNKNKKRKKRKANDAAVAESQSNGETNTANDACTDNNSGKRKGKKRKMEVVADIETSSKKRRESGSDNNTDPASVPSASGKFPWNKTIRLCLKSEPDRELSLKKLQRKVLAEYAAFGGEKRKFGENEIKATFTKKVTKNPKLLVAKDRVRLK